MSLPVSAPAAVGGGTASATINPGTGGVNFTAAAAPPVPRALLTASATLPAAGAFAALGTPASVPVGASFATLFVSYTRATGHAGAAQHLVYLGNGTDVGQTAGPDGTYAPILGPVPPTDTLVTYTVGPIDVRGGVTTVNVSSAEVGATANPGTLSVEITFS